MYGTNGEVHFKIDGKWKCMVLGRILQQGLKIMVGAPYAVMEVSVYYLRRMLIFLMVVSK
jgi:hypothetical protein